MTRCIASTLNGRRQVVGTVPPPSVLANKRRARKRDADSRVSPLEAAREEILRLKEQRAQAIFSVVHALNQCTDAHVRETLKRALATLREKA